MKKVLILQRAIPNYRLPLFQALCALQDVEITIGCAEHDEATSTGIPADNYQGVRLLPVKVHRLGGKFLFQSVVSLKPYDLVITDISINLLSVPVYLLLCRLRGIPVIGWGKGVPQLLDVPEPGFKKAYKKLIASACRALIVYGQISKKYFTENGLGSKPMFVAQNSVHTERFYEQWPTDAARAEALRKELQLQDRFVFGYFGKLTARKGVDKIIEAFRLVLQQEPRAFLLIAGGGPDKQRLERQAADLVSAGSLRFMGRVANGGEGPVLHLMDAYLSYSQGGLGILEAMATARTIISTPEVFPETELLEGDRNCILSDAFTPAAFAAAMHRAMLQPAFARQMGAAAQQTVKERAGTRVMVQAFRDAIHYTLRK